MFIRKLHIQVTGRTTECTLPLKKITGKERNIENLEEIWRKTPQKHKKSKYFRSPKVIPTPRKKVALSTTKDRKKKGGENYACDELPELHRRKFIHSATSLKTKTLPAFIRRKTRKPIVEDADDNSSDVEIIFLESDG